MEADPSPSLLRRESPSVVYTSYGQERKVVNRTLGITYTILWTPRLLLHPFIKGSVIPVENTDVRDQ